MRTLFLAFAIAEYICALAPAQADNIAQSILAKAQDACEAKEGRSFFLGEGAVTEIDLTGDGEPETLVDSRGFECKGALSIFSGSGGGYLTIIRGNERWEYLQQSWRVVPWNDQQVLLLWLHGTACGGAGADPCTLSVVWDGRNFVSVRNEK